MKMRPAMDPRFRWMRGVNKAPADANDTPRGGGRKTKAADAAGAAVSHLARTLREPRRSGRVLHERRAIRWSETPRAVPPYGTPVTADAHESQPERESQNMSEKNTFETILKWIVVVILAFAALKILLTVMGIAFFLGGVLLFRVLPIVLVVWLIVKAIEWLRSDRGSSATSTLDV